MDTTKTESPVHLPTKGHDPRLRKLSYSSVLTLHRCPREFELYRIGSRETEVEDEVSERQSVTFAYGHAIGAGIQAAMVGATQDEILFHMFCNWDANIFAANEKQHKSFAEAWFAVQYFCTLRKQGYLDGYEVAEFNGRPAVELGFNIILPNGYNYVGFVDLVLRHSITGHYAVLELKHTGLRSIHEAMYKNSAQALGYTIVLDSISPGLTEYDVYYLVFMTYNREYTSYIFPKSMLQKALWIRELLLDVDIAMMYEQAGVYPMHGESCLRYNRPCEYFGICTMSNKMLSTPYDPEVTYKGGSIVYDISLNITDLIDTQLRG